MSLENRDITKDVKEEEKEYEIEPISKFEFMIYLTYWFVILFLGCFSVYKLAYNPSTLKYFKESRYVTKSYFGLYESKYEYIWKENKELIYKGGLSFTFYVLFSKFLRSKTTPMTFMSGCLILTIYLNFHYSSWKNVLLQTVILIIPSIAGIFRLKSLVWISGLIMLYEIQYIIDMEWLNSSHMFQHIYPYIALLITRAISVGLTIADSPKYDFKLFLEMLFYYWYFPAIIGVRMMVVKDFIANIYEPYIIQDWKKWFFLAFRTILLFYIWAIVTLLIPFYLVFMTHDIKVMDCYILTGGQLYYGIHVFVSYFIMYNYSYLLTQLDGFLTAGGPQCICHIALWNRLWKSFDVAMHLWIKDTIFKPIVRLGDSKKTQIPAIIASFGFVIIFHGHKINTVLWIFLNIGQFVLYSYLIHGFHHSSWGHFMQNKFSPAWNRRLIATAGALSWLSSIYGFGAQCFGIEKINAMHMTSFQSHSNAYYHRGLIVLFLCYSHSQIALTVNEYLDKKKKKIL